MKFIIHDEPIYTMECERILTNIVNDKSIIDEVQRIVKTESNLVLAEVEALFVHAVHIENQVKKHIKFDMKGNTISGMDAAKMLFAENEHADNAFIDAFYLNDGTFKPIDKKYRGVFLAFCINMRAGLRLWDAENIKPGAVPPEIDDNTFFEFVQKSELSADDKMKALDIYFHYDDYAAYAHFLMTQTKNVLVKELKKIAKHTQDFINKTRDVWLDEDGKAFERVGLKLTDEEYHVYVSEYSVNWLSINGTSLTPPYLCVGTGVVKLLELKESAESEQDSAAQFLKAISDTTKQNILMILKNETLYGSQMAARLNCSGANISQHMSALMDLDVVTVTRKNNRVYFSLNKDAVIKHLDAAKGLFT